MGFSMLYYALYTTMVSLFTAPEIKAEDITTCCSTPNGCCGPDWELHCCNFVAKICCYGDERVLSMHHHNHHQHGYWNRHWVRVILCITLLMLIITGILLCFKRHRRSGRDTSEYKILPGYEYSSPQNISPTAPMVQTFQTTDEYPLTEYHNGRPQAYSLNANQMVSPPPYHDDI